MGYWVKHFVDGTKYVGEDENPQTTWRNSRNEGICYVELIHLDFYLRIDGLGEYWQSDLMEASFPAGTPTIKARSIQKLITPEDLFINRESAAKMVWAQVSNSPMAYKTVSTVRPEQVGKWLTLACVPATGLVIYTIKDNKL
jgi:hypothetical protein